MNKKILKATKLNFETMSPKLKGVNIFAKDFNIEPFLVITEYHMKGQVFGPHPHAGISVLTYMLPDSEQGFLNRDSLGDKSIIEPGGLHITQAGSGIHHDEFPIKDGIDSHGFQIWINHKENDRFVNPKSMHFRSKDVPEFIDKGVKVRILHGNYKHIESIHKMVTSVNLFDVYLDSNNHFSLPSNEMAFVYIISGSLFIDGVTYTEKSIIEFETHGSKINIQTSSSVCNFLYGTANQIKEPIVYGGPFVMTTETQLREARLRLGRGDMGILEPYLN